MIIPKKECDEHGVPLAWDECTECEGWGDERSPGRPLCSLCKGFGSLRAMVLAQLLKKENDDDCDCLIPYLDGAGQHSPGCRCFKPKEPRCESCRHPMSDGTWEGGNDESRAGPTMQTLAGEVQAGYWPPDEWAGWERLGTHFSRCDEGCRHGGPVRRGGYDIGPNAPIDLPAVVAQETARGAYVEASWRIVDVQFKNGWPHDLRLGNLVLLCTRCAAEKGL